MASVKHQWSRRRHALLPHHAASGLPWRRSHIATTL